MPNKSLVEAIVQFPQPTDVSGIRQFLGLASYYQRFIRNFAQIAEPLRELTHKNSTFQWTEPCEAAIVMLKKKLTSAPVLAFPSFDKPFTVETDASISGIGAALSQTQEDGKLHPVAYASRALTPAERNYSITELKTLAVMWALTRYHSYLYGQSVTVVTDHAAVRAILETPSPSCKHARWWMKVYSSGLKNIKIMYWAGRLNKVADALSRCPSDVAPAEGVTEQELQVASMQSEEVRGHSLTEINSEEIGDLLRCPPRCAQDGDFAVEQRNDLHLKEMIEFCEQGTLPVEEQTAHRLILQQSMFTLEVGICTTWTYDRDIRSEWLCQAIVESSYYGSITPPRWVATLQQRRPMGHSCGTGGGMACIGTS